MQVPSIGYIVLAVVMAGNEVFAAVAQVPVEESPGQRAQRLCNGAGIGLPGLGDAMPDQTTCVPGKTERCGDWTPVASVASGVENFWFTSARPGKLYTWEKNKTKCFYLFRSP